MEKIYMKYYNADGDLCLVIVDEYENIYVMNKDKLEVSKITPMGDLEMVLEDVDFEQGDLYVQKGYKRNFLEHIYDLRYDMDATLIGKIIQNTVEFETD